MTDELGLDDHPLWALMRAAVNLCDHATLPQAEGRVLQGDVDALVKAAEEHLRRCEESIMLRRLAAQALSALPSIAQCSHLDDAAIARVKAALEAQAYHE